MWCSHKYSCSRSDLNDEPEMSSCSLFSCSLQVRMALTLSSPCGYTYDEDEEIAVFESTAAEHRGQTRPRLPEISVISPGLDTQLSITEPVSVYGFMPLWCCSLFFNKSGCINVQHSYKTHMYIFNTKTNTHTYKYFKLCSCRKLQLNLQ